MGHPWTFRARMLEIQELCRGRWNRVQNISPRKSWGRDRISSGSGRWGGGQGLGPWIPGRVFGIQDQNPCICGPGTNFQRLGSKLCGRVLGSSGRVRAGSDREMHFPDRGTHFPDLESSCYDLDVRDQVGTGGFQVGTPASPVGAREVAVGSFRGPVGGSIGLDLEVAAQVGTVELPTWKVRDLPLKIEPLFTDEP